MPRIAGVGTAVPPHAVDQRDLRAAAARVFEGHLAEAARRLRVFDHAGIGRRHFSRPLEWYLKPRDFGERNDAYVEAALDVCQEACLRCLAGAGREARDVDDVILVSSTGLATPSLEARLLPRLGLREDVHRTPVWGLGCSGGVAALALAMRIARGEPGARVLVVAVELCSLAFQLEDHEKSNLVAAALFGDGAAAVLVEGDGAPPGPELIAAASHTWPGTLDVMGWDVTSRGLHVIFSRSIPAIVRAEAAPRMTAFLERQGYGVGDVARFILHPGGPRVLDAYREALALPEEAVAPAREVLRDCGNMSSPTVFFVLERVMAAPPPEGGLGLVAALGPGFTSEQVLLRWQGPRIR